MPTEIYILFYTGQEITNSWYGMRRVMNCFITRMYLHVSEGTSKEIREFCLVIFLYVAPMFLIPLSESHHIMNISF